MPRKVIAGSHIRGDVATVRRLAQTPDEHVRWDARFTGIEPLPVRDITGPQRFAYSTRLGSGLTIHGWGETIASKNGGGSALRFGSDDPKSLILEGAGTWTYAQEGACVRFRTVYDYRVRHGWWGRVIDRFAFRPFIRWATRWSFDRLRLWIEEAIPPEVSMRLWLIKRTCMLLLGVVWILSGLVPKILAVRASEVEIVRASGLSFGSPALTLNLLGSAEVLVGLWLISGFKERWAVGVTTLAMIGLAGLVIAFDRASITDPYGGIVKNVGLLGCAITVFVLSPLTPRASRARGEEAGR